MVILVLELFEGNTWTEPPLWIHELEYILTVFFLCMTIRRGYHVSFDLFSTNEVTSENTSSRLYGSTIDVMT